MWPNSAPPARMPGSRDDVGLRPQMGAPMRARLEHLDRVGPPEALLAVVADARAHPLAGDRVRHEDHAAVESGHADAAVGDVGSLELDLTAAHVTHPTEHRRAGRTVCREGTRVRLYLASTSPARLATLRAVGIDPIPVPSHVDEDAGRRGGGAARTRTTTSPLLARAKAEAVAEHLVDAGGVDGLVLGGDSAFVIDGAHLRQAAPPRGGARALARRSAAGPGCCTPDTG